MGGGGEGRGSVGTCRKSSKLEVDSYSVRKRRQSQSLGSDTEADFFLAGLFACSLRALFSSFCRCNSSSSFCFFTSSFLRSSSSSSSCCCISLRHWSQTQDGAGNRGQTAATCVMSMQPCLNDCTHTHTHACMHSRTYARIHTHTCACTCTDHYTSFSSKLQQHLRK